MNIIITGTGFSFPDGTGATSRVIAFAKGLMHHGAKVNVLCPKPTESKHTGNRNLQLKGVYEGIPFEYTCGQRMIARSRFGALLLYLKGLWYACQSILSINKKQPVDAMLLWYAELPLNFFVFSVMAKFIGAVLIVEKSEFPFVYSSKTFTVRVMLFIYEKVTLKVIDGAIVISSFLEEYFIAHINGSAKILRMPILVDTVCFASMPRNGEHTKHRIIFCGNLENNGEVLDLLKAFGEVANDYPQWNLELIGPLPHWKTENAIREFLVKLGLVERVTFFGAVPRVEIPAKLNVGDIMVLPRASGSFSTAGFPTKLGEYLATGKPVVVTATGDIPKYLKDNESAYLVSPDNIDSFAKRLRYVMSHNEEASEVGMRGRDVAIREFDLYGQSKRLLNFIRELRYAKNS